MELTINGQKIEVSGGNLDVTLDKDGNLKIAVSSVDPEHAKGEPLSGQAAFFELLKRHAEEMKKLQPAPSYPIYPKMPDLWQQRPIWISAIQGVARWNEFQSGTRNY